MSPFTTHPLAEKLTRAVEFLGLGNASKPSTRLPNEDAYPEVDFG